MVIPAKRAYRGGSSFSSSDDASITRSSASARCAIGVSSRVASMFRIISLSTP